MRFFYLKNLIVGIILYGGFGSCVFSQSISINHTRNSTQYELTNHLGNVLATISDAKTPSGGLASVLTTTDYYAFGMEIKERSYALDRTFRYGYNGKENDRDWGTGLIQDYGFRLYNPAVARFLSVDPLSSKYPWYTPFQFAGNMPIRYFDLDGLEPADNPKNPVNQNNRNPTTTINSIFEESGGLNNYIKNWRNYLQGTYVKETSTAGMSNKPGYTSDSKDGAEIGNLWVNNTLVYKASDYQNFDTRDFCNFLLGNMIYGIGPENIEFPLNGVVSNYMKDAGIVLDAMNRWYSVNKGSSDLVGIKNEFSGDDHMLGAAINKGIFHIESFVGSATITITPIDNKEVLVQIFNVTSLTSGDPYKNFFEKLGNPVPISVVRDLTSNGGANIYGNISQLYQFTMPIDETKLK